MRTRLKRIDVENHPHLIWNAFIDTIANCYEELDSEQRPAHLVFHYESEVQNGGHLQYFENAGISRLAETIAALNQLGASGQAAVLTEAGQLYSGTPRQRLDSAEAYVSAALENEFGSFDNQFHECSPSLIDSLKKLLERHQRSFIEIVD